jgi:multidrug resistance efflux pump
MKKRTLIIAIAVLVVISAVIFFAFNRGKDNGAIRSTGIIEGIEVNLSPKVAGRISYICCNEGDHVKEGEVAVKLESEDLLASVDQARAGVEMARAEIKVSESSIDNSKANILATEADIKSAEADLEKTRVQMELAKSEMDRSNSLFKKDFISKESLDLAVTAYNASVADYASSQSRVASAHSKRDAAESQLHTAESRLTSAKANLKQSEANLSYNLAKLSDTTITSPLSGNVVFKALEKGETVSPGMTILTIVNMHDLYARVDIDETVIDSIALNARVSIKTEGTTGRVFNGTVYEIGRYAEFATQRDVVRGRQDIKTFRVKIRVEDAGGVLKPGMTVEVEIPRKK